MDGISYSLPAPVGGWNARDLKEAMPETDALDMVNVVPDFATVKFRPGYAAFTTSLISLPVETLLEHIEADGTRKLLAASGGSIFDVTSGGSGTILRSGLTNAKWQHIEFGHTTFLVNGANTCIGYTSGGGAVNVSWTGPTDPTKLVNVGTYKRRLYFAETNSSSVWYGGVDSKSGVLTEFDVGTYLSVGGYVVWCGGWNSDTGAGLRNQFVIVSSMGEVLVYEGSYPGDASWVLVGSYRLPEPLGRRSVWNVEGDLLLITEEGTIVLSEVIRTNSVVGERIKFTSKVVNAFTESANRYSSNFGWEGIVYPRRNWAIINIPVSESSNSEQYVVNLKTGSWCRFTGIDAACFALFNRDLYFGGNDGFVYRFGGAYSDNNKEIEFILKYSYNRFNRSNVNPRSVRLKQLNLVRPLLNATSNINFTIQDSVDFVDSGNPGNIVSTQGNPGTAWGSAWGSSWGFSFSRVANWTSVNGVGNAHSIGLYAKLKNVQVELSSTNVIYRQGGFL